MSETGISQGCQNSHIEQSRRYFAEARWWNGVTTGLAIGTLIGTVISNVVWAILTRWVG